MTRGKVFRAVSPVVAVTLLIIVAVVTAVVLYTWVNGIVTSQPSSQQARLEEAIKIEAVNITNGKIYNVTVRNVGSITIPEGGITTVYIIDASTNKIIAAEDVSSNVTQAVKPGDVAILDFPNGVDVSSYSTVLVKVVTKDGVEATYLVPVR